MLMNSTIGVNGLFYILGFLQVLAFIVLNMIMKETKGLSAQEKKELYFVNKTSKAEQLQPKTIK